MAYWQRLNCGLGYKAAKIEAQLLVSPGQTRPARPVGAGSRPLWTRPAGLLGRQTPSGAVKTGKKLAQSVWGLGVSWSEIRVKRIT